MSARRLAIAGSSVAMALCGLWIMTPASRAEAPLTGETPSPAPVATPADDVPRGMVAFVDGGACPAGWAPATIAAGRLLVGTDVAGAVGHVVGTPLAALEDRGHGHPMTGANLALPYKSISAADGSNQNGASAGAQPLTGTVASAASGLPFAQLTACVSP